MADTVAVLRPNGSTPSGTTAIGGGAASLHAAMADDLDATYAQTAGGAFIYLDMTTVTIPALAIIKSVTPRVRAGHPVVNNSGVRFSVNLGSNTSPANQPMAATAGVIYSFTGASLSTRPGGGAWTQADIDAVRLMVDTMYVSYTGNWYEGYLDVAYNQAPVATPTAPSGAVTTTSQPTVTWTYSDPEADAQERYRVKVFTAAQYGAGGFDPETSTPTWDSGEVFSAATSAQTGPLANSTTFRAYVKVADAGSSGRYGAWSFVGFNIAVTAPPQPTLIATVDNTLARVSLAATHGSFGSAQTFVIERSVDGGTTWTTVRGANGIPPSGGSSVTIYDYEITRGVSTQYRVSTRATVGGFLLSSPYSTTQTVTPAQTGWWLKDPLSPGLNHQPEVIPPFDFKRKNPSRTYDPLGRTTSVVVSDGVKGIAGTLNVRSQTKARYDKLEAILATGRTLFLEDVLGRTWYVDVSDDFSWSWVKAQPATGETTPLRHLHEVSLPFVEVGRPPGDTVTAGTPTP